MMNLVVAIGRFTKDPVLAGDEKMYRTRFVLGLDREVPRSNKNTQTADFPSFIAWGKTAEVICRHFKKGNRICVTGHLTTGSYISKDGKRVYTTDVTVDKFRFVDSLKKQEEAGSAVVGDFVDISDEIDEEVPFS